MVALLTQPFLIINASVVQATLAIPVSESRNNQNCLLNKCQCHR
jgi:hypothetical protein